LRGGDGADSRYYYNAREGVPEVQCFEYGNFDNYGGRPSLGKFSSAFDLLTVDRRIRNESQLKRKVRPPRAVTVNPAAGSSRADVHTNKHLYVTYIDLLYC